jgi:hypothetical protein
MRVEAGAAHKQGAFVLRARHVIGHGYRADAEHAALKVFDSGEMVFAAVLMIKTRHA